jgi:2-desacetyl-2-hydroxyethyl bacteriochlorophyllide A dehydrogenase
VAGGTIRGLMRAVRATDDGVRVVDAPEPADDATTLRVQAVSICGSDLHLVEQGPLPFTIGHEFAGTLDDGRTVAVDPNSPCGACDECAAGASHRCRTGSQRVLGFAADGGMAERVAVGGHALVELPSGLRAEDACLVEPLGVAAHGVRQAALGGGERVAVVGAGGIGLAAVAAARAHAGEVGLVARHDRQRESGERLGAVSPRGEYDVVLECAGTQSALDEAVERCRPGGLVVLLSTHWEPVVVPGIPALMKEVSFRWSYTYGAYDHRTDLDDAAALLAEDPEIAATLVTHRFPLEDATQAFRVAADRAAGAIKVVLEP